MNLQQLMTSIGRGVASHECLGRAVAVGTWVVVVIVHDMSANQSVYWWKITERSVAPPPCRHRTGSHRELPETNCAFTASTVGQLDPCPRTNCNC